MSALTLERPEQAELLLERLHQEILGELLKKPLSASEIARQIERPLKTVLYRLEKLREAGLVRVQEVRERAGRAVKVYCACSSGGWTFPFTLTSAATARELIESQMLPLMSELMGHLAAGLREELWMSLTLDAKGEVGFSIGPRADIPRPTPLPPSIGTLTDAHLTLEQARALADKLREFGRELATYPEDSSLPTYYVGLFFVPKAEG